MLEVIATIMTAMSTAMAILTAAWIIRKTKTIKSMHGILSFSTIAYSIYHFMAFGIGMIDPLDSLVAGLFILGVAWSNAYCATGYISIVNVGINRRKIEHVDLQKSERRKDESHLLFKLLEKS